MCPVASKLSLLTIPLLGSKDFSAHVPCVCMPEEGSVYLSNGCRCCPCCVTSNVLECMGGMSRSGAPVAPEGQLVRELRNRPPLGPGPPTRPNFWADASMELLSAAGLGCLLVGKMRGKDGRLGRGMGMGRGPRELLVRVTVAAFGSLVHGVVSMTLNARSEAAGMSDPILDRVVLSPVPCCERRVKACVRPVIASATDGVLPAMEGRLARLPNCASVAAGERLALLLLQLLLRLPGVVRALPAWDSLELP
mmetsp:Transcript_2922/g.7617  ORF Transcript_2922/g.7617 Transcript_2922/m.7617 type:complete len:251 (-) Transcript_2922:2083-2835(-)